MSLFTKNVATDIIDRLDTKYTVIVNLRNSHDENVEKNHHLAKTVFAHISTLYRDMKYRFAPGERASKTDIRMCNPFWTIW